MLIWVNNAQIGHAEPHGMDDQRRSWDWVQIVGYTTLIVTALTLVIVWASVALPRL
jgi:hypothetical protein